MAAADGGAIEFRVLGPVEVCRNGTTLALGGPRQRAVLALLLLEPGRPVSAERFADELWHGEPPPGSSTTVRAYVSRLRSALGDGASITSAAAGYVLDVAPERVDARRFERLLREGEDAFARGVVGRAAERLRAALELWRGEPFGELGVEGTLGLEARRLVELRLLAIEKRIEADLALGNDPELVAELEALVEEHPFRESLWRQLMLALYRGGRQADALAAYRRARGILEQELGLQPGEDLRRLEQQILRHEVEAPRARPRLENLPAPLTSFVGRDAELPELEHLVTQSRLVTLTGVGGAGKTRLALELATRAASAFGQVAFVDLSGLTEAELVARHVVTALEVREQPDASFVELIAKQVRDIDVLLVLDNCEHLRDASAEMAAALLAAAPHLHVLATSRELLGVPGELDYPVPPLDVPAAGATEDDLRESEGVKLFLERARAARPHLPMDSATLTTAARICRDLDGLPLAIELAAARARVLSLEEIATRLDDRFRFLVSWRRLTAARHRTLREAMDWSYELLAPDERTLLARLSVFAGGFTRPAAAEVCLDGDDRAAERLLERLVDASLVVPEERDGAMRYRLLETVRQYGGERLEEADDVAEVRDRLADWCLRLVEEAEPQLSGEEQTRWLAILETERDNLSAALLWLGADADRRLRLAIALSRFWYIRGYLGEGRRELEQALGDRDGTDVALRRRGLTAAASLALLQGDYDSATRFADRALDAARAAGEQLYVANALSNLGAIVLAAGEHARARTLLEEAVALAREVGDRRIMALAINNLGDLALTVGDYKSAEPLFEESLALLRERGDTANIARSLFNQGAVALMLGRPGAAAHRLRESLRHALEVEDKEDLAWCLEGFAGVAAAEGDGERAGVLIGAAGAVLAEMGAELKPFERQLHDTSRAQAVGLCGEAAFAEAERRGAALPLADAVELALA